MEILNGYASEMDITAKTTKLSGLKQLILHRSGTFLIDNDQFSNNHCGSKELESERTGHMFEYSVEITAAYDEERGLDNNGFIIDQILLDKAINNHYIERKITSCEEESWNILRLIFEMIDDNIFIERIKVMVVPPMPQTGYDPRDKAHITAIWQRNGR